MRQAGLNPAARHCNQLVSWGPDLQAQAPGVADQIQAERPHAALATAEARASFHDRVSDILFWRLVRTLIIDAEQHNAGVIALRGHHWTDSSGVRHPVLVFRSAIVNIGAGGPLLLAVLAAERSGAPCGESLRRRQDSSGSEQRP